MTRSYETQLLVPRFLEEVVAADIEVSQEEMEGWYEEHKEGYHRLPRVRLGQITVAERADADRIAEQLRGKAGDRQVKNAKRGLTQNMGGSGGSTLVHILEVK